MNGQAGKAKPRFMGASDGKSGKLTIKNGVLPGAKSRARKSSKNSKLLS